MALLRFGNTELHPHALYSLYADSPPPTQNIKINSYLNDSTGVFRIYFGIFCYYKSQNFLELTRTLYWSIKLYTYNISKSWDVSSLSFFFNYSILWRYRPNLSDRARGDRIDRPLSGKAPGNRRHSEEMSSRESNCVLKNSGYSMHHAEIDQRWPKL